MSDTTTISKIRLFITGEVGYSEVSDRIPGYENDLPQAQIAAREIYLRQELSLDNNTKVFQLPGFKESDEYIDRIEVRPQGNLRNQCEIIMLHTLSDYFIGKISDLFLSQIANALWVKSIRAKEVSTDIETEMLYLGDWEYYILVSSDAGMRSERKAAERFYNVLSTRAATLP